MWFRLTAKRARLKRPALIVALSTSIPQYRALYSQAREVANYMFKKMSFKHLGSLYSSAMPPEVLVREEGVSSLPSCDFYVNRGERDLVLLAGDTSPVDSQYDFAKVVLRYARSIGVREVYSIGARWTEAPVTGFQEPELNGFATDEKGIKKLESEHIKIIRNEPAPFFASIVVGLAPSFGIRGFKIQVDHGEPAPHTRTVVKMLEVMSRMIGFELDLEELRQQITPKPQARSPDGGSIYH